MGLGPIYAGVPGGLVRLKQLKGSGQLTLQLFSVSIVLVGKIGPEVSWVGLSQ